MAVAMMDCSQLLERLREPFPDTDIEWRVQRTLRRNNKWYAVVLPYVTSRAIMNRLDDVFGLTGWKNEFLRWGERGVKCRLWVKIGDEWLYREDGASFEDNKEHIDQIKSTFSNALKRAAVQFGIGRYLYYLDETIVELKTQGKNYVKIKEGNQEKYLYWDPPQLPAWALPKGNREESNTAVVPKPNQNQQNPQQMQQNNKRIKLVKELQNMRPRVGLANDGWFIGLYKTVNNQPNANFESVQQLYEQANIEELQKLYSVMKPVSAVVAAGDNYNISEKRLLELCQIITKQEITSVVNALLKVRDEHVRPIIELCRAEQKQQQQRRGA
jgi:hypothetical protein